MCSDMTRLDVLLGLAFAVIADLLSNWSTILSAWIVRRAAGRLPAEHARRWEEEWLGTLHTRPRLLRMFFALDLFRASLRIRRQHERDSSSQTHVWNPSLRFTPAAPRAEVAALREAYRQWLSVKG